MIDYCKKKQKPIKDTKESCEHWVSVNPFQNKEPHCYSCRHFTGSSD